MMKQTMSMHAAALGLVLSALPAWAGDIVQISQDGRSNTFAIEQVASNGNNVVNLRQGTAFPYGLENTANVVQHGVDNAVVDILQYHWNHLANVFQHDGSDLRVTINSQVVDGFVESNTVNVDQSGFGARVQIDQTGVHGRADIVQSGWGGGIDATVRQSGDAHQATVFQTGGNVAATIVQGGNLFGWGYAAGNTATIRQGF